MSETKTRVLFVDDEEFLLNGLRRMLRSHRSEWDMVFVNSGEKALEQMAIKPFDVIVSDMRMPAMSGSELLRRVQQEYPSTVRLVLSGQADYEEIVTSVGPIHQFMHKPCDLDVLVSAVNRTCELGQLFNDQQLRRLVTELESLPSVSSLQEELLAKLNCEDATPQEIGEAIGQDLGTTTKILQLVNSSFFGLTRKVTTPSEAVLLLGMDTVRSLVIAMQVYSQVKGPAAPGFSERQLFSHSLAVATIAKQIALHECYPKKDVERAFLAGLLHDIGKLVLATYRSQEYAEVLDITRDGTITAEEAEHDRIGATHGEVGGYLLCLWAFADPIVDTAIFHHSPSRHDSSTFSELTAVHVANAIVNSDTHNDDTALAGIDKPYLDRLGLADQLASWRAVPRVAA
ncbi:MAG: HDOD domain-containing protein [Phycisphaeraceae bacterium]|nr:HDOD domain-containing protein [Phycisphaerales bacterium]MCB9858833.1 HDOD domain-containing protein [Phycisphaeraceae bacterium]